MEKMFGIGGKLEQLAQEIDLQCAGRYAKIERAAARGSRKVLAAFVKNRVSETHFIKTTGYGYGDAGRECIDRIYADVFGAERAMVRHFMVSGTHAISVALFGVLRPGDEFCSVTGRPYDTLHGVIGLGGGAGSLAEFGVKYTELPLKEGRIDFEAVEKKAAQKIKMIYIQRSRGYASRPSVTIGEIERVARIVKSASPETVVMVDNCYGEFVEEKEPTAAGADLMAGSLIKNPGGGIAECGGYIAGREDLVELCAARLTTPTQGAEVGASLGQNKAVLQGFYYAPTAVGSSLKTAVFAAALFERLGFRCSPCWDEERTDIIEQIDLGSEKGLLAFCEGIQKGSPIDGFVVPCAWDMPGYGEKVVMAAGAFQSGSSIELSADGPLKPPYTAFMQGGVIFDTAKVGVLCAAQKLIDSGLVSL